MFMAAVGAGTVCGFAGETNRPSPEFVVRMPDGKHLLLTSLKGKVLAVEFLHTTCPHCAEASATMEKLYKELGPKGFLPIGVAFNDMAMLLVPDYIKQGGLTFPVGVAPREEVVSYLVEPFRFVPQLVIIDKKFTIRGQYGGDDDFFKNKEANMRASVEMLLKERGAPAAAKPKPAAKKTTAAKR